MLNAQAVRLADRYMSASSPVSINRSGRLAHFLLLSALLCGFATASIFTLGSIHTRHRVIHDVDVAFELTCAPPEPSFRAVDQLVPLRFEEGQKPAALANKESDIAATGNQTQDTVTDGKTARAEKATRAVPEEAPIAVARPVISSASAPRPMAVLPPNPFTGNAANAATPELSTAAGGAADGVAGATGKGGTGAGVGQGDPNALAGGDFGAQNLIAMKVPAVALGNIGPYKRDVVARLRRLWHPETNYGSVTVEIALDHDGKVVDKKIVVSSGNDKLDTGLLEAIGAAQFAALPDWYHGEQLHIQLRLHNS